MRRAAAKCRAARVGFVAKGDPMKIRMLEHGLHYCGRAQGARQTYHVFEAQDDFFVMSTLINVPGGSLPSINLMLSA